MILLKDDDPVWKTKDGRRIPVEDIDNLHLLNIRRFIFKVRDTHRGYLMERGAHGSMWFDQHAMCNQNLRIIQKEIDKRNLDDPKVRLLMLEEID